MRFLRSSVYNETTNGSLLSKRRTVFIWVSKSYGRRACNDAAKGYGALKTMISGANPFQLQNALRSALKLRFFKGWGDVWGFAPSPTEGIIPSDSHLRFAAV